MKLEFAASDMLALNSKTYLAKSNDNHKIKYSAKGVNKQFVDPSCHFETVMKTKTSCYAENREIAIYNNKMFSY